MCPDRLDPEFRSDDPERLGEFEANLVAARTWTAQEHREVLRADDRTPRPSDLPEDPPRIDMDRHRAVGPPVHGSDRRGLFTRDRLDAGQA